MAAWVTSRGWVCLAQVLNNYRDLLTRQCMVFLNSKGLYGGFSIDFYQLIVPWVTRPALHIIERGSLEDSENSIISRELLGKKEYNIGDSTRSFVIFPAFWNYPFAETLFFFHALTFVLTSFFSLLQNSLPPLTRSQTLVLDFWKTQWSWMSISPLTEKKEKCDAGLVILLKIAPRGTIAETICTVGRKSLDWSVHAALFPSLRCSTSEWPRSWT